MNSPSDWELQTKLWWRSQWWLKESCNWRSFQEFLGSCYCLEKITWPKEFLKTPPIAAIKIGVQIAWSRGFQQFQVESDSQVVAITLLTTGCPTYHPCFSLTQEILKFLELGGSISWHHALREGNQVADCLAKFGLSYLTRLKKIVNSPIWKRTRA